MICMYCGGLVVWQGPLSKLTYTKCMKCGRENCQIVEADQPDDETQEEEIK